MTSLEALAAIREAANTAAAVGELPAFLGEIQRVCAEALLDAASRSAPAAAPRLPGRVLTVQEAKTRLGRSASWIYRNKATLPVTRFPTGGFGFEERALDRWLAARTSVARDSR